MAIIARFVFDVPFGRKEELFGLMGQIREFETTFGYPRPQTLVGAIGAESRVETNYRFESLTALDAVWTKVGQQAPRMAQFHRDVAALVVPGSNRWEIFRVHEE